MAGFHLVIHQIPFEVSKGIEMHSPPERRGAAAIRLDYPVEDLMAARTSATQLDGQIDEAPPEWAERNSRYLLGFGPEGNVFGVTTQSG
jgi:hypothetical protein